MTPLCFSCKRPASRYDDALKAWVCEGNLDCAMSVGGQPLPGATMGCPKCGTPIPPNLLSCPICLAERADQDIPIQQRQFLARAVLGKMPMVLQGYRRKPLHIREFPDGVKTFCGIDFVGMRGAAKHIVYWQYVEKASTSVCTECLQNVRATLEKMNEQRIQTAAT